MERWQILLLEKFPKVKEKYEQEYKAEVEVLRKRMVDELPIHQWWKEYDIKEMNLRLEKIDQRIIFTKYMLDLAECYLAAENINETKYFLNAIEEEVVKMNKEEKGEFDIFIIESIVNRLYGSGHFNNFYNNAGPEVKKMCDRYINRGSKKNFWEKMKTLK